MALGLALVGAGLILPPVVRSAAGPVEVNSKSGLAISGFDPVAYFTDGKPEKGSKDFTFAFDDTTYWFKSAAHRDKFAADPEHYAPQFDGYCAIQLSRGHIQGV